MTAIRSISDCSAKSNALVSLAINLAEPLRSKLLREGLEAAYSIDEEASRGRAFVNLAPHLSECLLGEMQMEVYKILNDNLRVRTLLDLAPYVQGSMQMELLDQVVLAASVSHKGMLKTVRALTVTGYPEKAFKLAQQTDKEYIKRDILKIVAQHLPETLLDQALILVQKMKYPRCQLEALHAIIPRLSEKQSTEALKIAQEMYNRVDKDKSIAVLARCMAELTHYKEALTLVWKISDSNVWEEELSSLAKDLTQSALQELLKLLWTIEDDLEEDNKFVRGLTVLVPYLQDPQRKEVIKEILTLSTTIG